MFRLWWFLHFIMPDGMGGIQTCQTTSAPTGTSTTFSFKDPELGSGFSRTGTKITKVEGNIEIISADGKHRPAKVGETIQPGEQVVLHSNEFPSLTKTIDPFSKSMSCEPSVDSSHNPVASVSEVGEKVYIQRANSDTWVPAQVGDKLYQGDKIQTTANNQSKVTIKDAVGEEIRIPYSTTLTLQADRDKGKHLIDLLQNIWEKILPHRQDKTNSSVPISNIESSATPPHN